MVLLENSRVTVARNPRDGIRYYSRPMTIDHYELLREFIDDVDRLAATLMVVVTNYDFIDEQAARGWDIYSALKTRIMGRRPRQKSCQSDRGPGAVDVRRHGMSLGRGGESAVASRLALEALRSGVPNRSAVRLLGCNQPRVEKQFVEMLNGGRRRRRDGCGRPGDADFGRLRIGEVAPAGAFGTPCA